MKRFLLGGSWSAALLVLLSGHVQAADQAHLDTSASPRLALIATSTGAALEATTVSGGSWFTKSVLSHIAVVVEHPEGRLLFDTGLGRNIDQQFDQDMSWFYKPMLSYEAVTPARDQLEAAGIEISRIIPSHAHWDHVSGLVDFPEAEVWVSKNERNFIAKEGPPTVLPSQVMSPEIQWQMFSWDNKPFHGFDRSYDLFGDGTVTLVPLEGHTPGGVGMYVMTAQGDFFFIGDTTWSLKGITMRSPKFWVARNMADFDAEQVDREIALIADMLEANPELTVVPAHDRSVHDALGYFPNWVE